MAVSKCRKCRVKKRVGTGLRRYMITTPHYEHALWYCFDCVTELRDAWASEPNHNITDMSDVEKRNG